MKKFFIIFITLLFSTSLLSKNRGKFIPHVDVFKVPPRHNIEVNLKYPARLKAFEKVTIIARVEGILEKKFFKEGEFVKKGSLLFEIEPDIYLTELNSAKANLRKALANLKDAEKNRIRMESLYKDNATSEEKRDKAYYLYEKYKAEVDFAKSKVKKAEINLNYTKIKAPINGFTGLKYTDPGNLVHNGSKLLQITGINPIYVEFSVPDKDFIKYNLLSEVKKKKLSVKLEINGKILKKSGYVDFSDVNIDKFTSSVKLRAIFQNNNNELFPGEFVRVILKGVYLKDKIEIPQQALLQNERGKIVFIVKNGAVSVSPVITGGTNENNFIIEKGVKKGDLVILNNFFKIRPKATVKIDKTISP